MYISRRNLRPFAPTSRWILPLGLGFGFRPHGSGCTWIFCEQSNVSWLLPVGISRRQNPPPPPLSCSPSSHTSTSLCLAFRLVFGRSQYSCLSSLPSLFVCAARPRGSVDYNVAKTCACPDSNSVGRSDQCQSSSCARLPLQPLL